MARGMSSVLMLFMHSIFGRPKLSFDSTGRALPVTHTPGTGPPMLGSFCAGLLRQHPSPYLFHDSTRASGARLETLGHTGNNKLYSKASDNQFGSSLVGFLGYAAQGRLP